MTNALHWAAGDGAPARPRIGVTLRTTREREFRAYLTEVGHRVVEVALTANSLEEVDVVVLELWNQSARELEALSEFVRGGGGLVTASTGWGWAYLHPDLDIINDYAGNRLLAPVGIQWADDSHDRTSPEGFAVDGPPPGLTHAGTALDALEAHENGKRTLTQPEIDQALESLIRAARFLPLDDALLAPRLRNLVAGDEHERQRPSSEQPVGKADATPRLVAMLSGVEHSRISPDSVRAHPAADDFPGPVPYDAPRITRSLTIDTAIPRWRSTGLYAAPNRRATCCVRGTPSTARSTC